MEKFSVSHPIFSIFSSRNVQILSQQDAYESTQRSTNILNGLERFMGNNLIDIFGCDYSSSGISMNFIDAKIKSFFARRTTDGRRYDTYFLYFSGPTCENGDIILSGRPITSLLHLIHTYFHSNR